MMRWCGVIWFYLAAAQALEMDAERLWSDSQGVETVDVHNEKHKNETVEEPEENPETVGFCHFGNIPSGLCMVKCFWEKKKAFCDEESRCFCDVYDEDDSHEDGDDFEETDPTVEGFCFFGQFPSASCKLLCFVKGKTAVCDEESKCRCEESDNEPFTTISEHNSMEYTIDRPSTQTQDSENDIAVRDDGSSVRYILVFLFGLEEGSDANEVDSQTSSEHTSVGSSWKYTQLVSLAIMFLLATWVVVVVLLFFKKKHSFKKECLTNVIVPPAMEKSCMNGKQ